MPSRDKRLRLLLLLLLPLALLLPGVAAFPYPASPGAYSDLAISHYPAVVFLQRAVLEWGRVPLWSPGILSGAPLAANPLSGLWYPPGWLALLLPLPLGFNLLIALHLAWGGLGMYLLLRAEGLGRPAALLGGLAFEALPKLFAHYGAGHLTLLYAVPWTPWLLREAAGPKLKGAIFQPAAFNLSTPIVFALIFLADVRWAAYAGVLWWSYTLAHRYSLRFPLRRSARTTTSQPPTSDPAPNFSLGPIITLGLQTGLALLLAAPLLLPLLEYTRLSTRARLAPGDVFAFSLPAPRLLGLVFPDFGGSHEYMLYSGAAVLALALLAVTWRRGPAQIPALQGVPFWTFTAVFALLVSLGSGLPFLAPLASLPGLSLLRVPSRALFVLGLALAALAAVSVERILAGVSPIEKRRCSLLLVGLAGFALALALGVAVLLGKLPARFAWGAGFSLAAALWLGLGLSGRLPGRAWFGVLLALYLLDLGVVDFSLFSPRPAASVLAEGKALAQYLAAQPGLFRVYSPSYSLPQQTAMQYGLELADGVDPLQLWSYAAFMAQASGVPAQGYSVTLPPFGDADPAQANAAYRPDPARLGLLNVRYVAAQFDLQVEGLVPQARFGETRLYLNRAALSRAWVQPFDAPAGEQPVPAEITSWAPDRIELRASWNASQSPGLLVLSELAYPGWQVRLDGRPVEMLTVAGLLRGVRLPPGEHRVVFEFHPASVSMGLALWGLGMATLLALKAVQARRRAAARQASIQPPVSAGWTEPRQP